MLGKKALIVINNGLFEGIDACLIRLVLGEKSRTVISNGVDTAFNDYLMYKFVCNVMK